MGDFFNVLLVFILLQFCLQFICSLIDNLNDTHAQVNSPAHVDPYLEGEEFFLPTKHSPLYFLKQTQFECGVCALCNVFQAKIFTTEIFNKIANDLEIQHEDLVLDLREGSGMYNVQVLLEAVAKNGYTMSLFRTNIKDVSEFWLHHKDKNEILNEDGTRGRIASLPSAKFVILGNNHYTSAFEGPENGFYYADSLKEGLRQFQSKDTFITFLLSRIKSIDYFVYLVAEREEMKDFQPWSRKSPSEGLSDEGQGKSTSLRLRDKKNN